MGNSKGVLAWYFSAADCRLRYGDGRLIEVGATHTVTVTPSPCNAGLHGSRNIMDALANAPGTVIWRVSIADSIAEQRDKLCGKSRTYLWGYDAYSVLRDFARKCALDVAHLWKIPEVVRQYLETGDEPQRYAARAAARDAAWDAAGYAARDAAGAAARDAAWAAAGAAARDAAGAAAGAAARAAQEKRLLHMIRKGRTS